MEADKHITETDLDDIIPGILFYFKNNNKLLHLFFFIFLNNHNNLLYFLFNVFTFLDILFLNESDGEISVAKNLFPLILHNISTNINLQNNQHLSNIVSLIEQELSSTSLSMSSTL